jgi:hypothetical protein
MNRGKELPLPKRLRYDNSCGFLWDDADQNVAVADTQSRDGLRLRGWGHLTGTGGLNLSPEEAAAFQDRVGEYVMLAWNFCMAAEFSIEELRESLEIAEELDGK